MLWLLSLLLTAALEPSAAGAAAPLRDLTRLRPAPSSARIGLMAKAERRLLLLLSGGGLLDGSAGATDRS